MAAKLRSFLTLCQKRASDSWYFLKIYFKDIFIFVLIVSCVRIRY